MKEREIMEHSLRRVEDGAKTRKILHLDLDAFFCAVEEQLNPKLRGKPIAVGGQPDKRGVVASASYPARKFGVRSAMPMSQALRLCPQLIVVPQTRGAYVEMSRAVMQTLEAMAPEVEQISIDEAFLDVTILREPLEAIALGLQREIRQRLELPCSIGGATNKLVAKTANNIGKARKPKDQPPNAITIVTAGDEAAFMAPLPVRELWGVGPKTAETLHAFGIITAGDLARRGEADLRRALGKLGGELWYRARGIDDRPVAPWGDAKQISKETTFVEDVADEAELKLTLRRLCDSLGRRARKENLAGDIVKIKLRFSDFRTVTRQVSLDEAIDRDDRIYHFALQLLDEHWTPGTPLRLIGVMLGGFVNRERQLDLWAHPQGDSEADGLQTALDALRDLYGEESIRRASDLQFQFSDDNRR